MVFFIIALIFTDTSLSIKTCCLGDNLTRLYFSVLADFTVAISFVTINNLANNPKFIAVKKRIAILIKTYMANSLISSELLQLLDEVVTRSLAKTTVLWYNFIEITLKSQEKEAL